MMIPIADKNSFIGYNVPLKRAKFLILPIPYEQTTSYIGGTKNGPEAIIRASHYVELFDEEAGVEAYLTGINTLEHINFQNLIPDDAINRIYSTVKQLPIKEKFLISLGGEHSITYPIVKAYKEKFKSLSVLHVDAHSDLRESYQGSIYSHGSVMARIKDMATIVQVGIRSQSKEEYETIKKDRIHTFYMHNIRKDAQWKEHATESLHDNVYLTIDLDGFDPSVAPAVGTPEPGGLGWYDVIDLIKMVIKHHNLVGCDVVELSPAPLSINTDFLAARLVYKIITAMLYKY